MTYLIVGLGNPGEKYKNTRHNAGWMVIEDLKENADFSNWRKEKKAKGCVSDGTLETSGEEITLLMPNTFMNLSGKSVRAFVKKEKDAKKMILIHDEIDLPIGGVQISFGKGAGGHNGVQSVINEIKTKNFIRIRVGISPVNWFGNMKKPQGKRSVADFVLREFTKRERDRFEKSLSIATEAIKVIVKKGHLEAMNEFNEG